MGERSPPHIMIEKTEINENLESKIKAKKRAQRKKNVSALMSKSEREANANARTKE